MMRRMLALRSFVLRPLGGASRRRRRRLSTLRTLDGLFAEMITAVNARGLCAAEVARLAELPKGEVLAMANRCGCQVCFRRRAN